MFEIGLSHYMTVSAILFTLGTFGIFLNRKNVIIIMMSVELMLLAVNINLVAFSAELLGGLGPQAENDLAVIGAVRGSLLAGDRLMLDANQAWDVDGTMDGPLYDPGFEPGATKA